VVVLPSFVKGEYGSFIVLDFMSGRLHRVVGDYNSRSPLSEPEHHQLTNHSLTKSDVGEIHRVGVFYYSHSPLSEPELGCYQVII